MSKPRRRDLYWRRTSVQNRPCDRRVLVQAYRKLLSFKRRRLVSLQSILRLTLKVELHLLGGFRQIRISGVIKTLMFNFRSCCRRRLDDNKALEYLWWWDLIRTMYYYIWRECWNGKTIIAIADYFLEALTKYRPDGNCFVTYTRKGCWNRCGGLHQIKTLLHDLHFKTLTHCVSYVTLARKNIINSIRYSSVQSGAWFLPWLWTMRFGHVTEDDRLLQRYDAERSGSKRGVFVTVIMTAFRYDRLVNAYKASKRATTS